MTVFPIKAFAAFSIFLLTLIPGLAQLRLVARYKHLLHLGDAFASGIFLSAALLHLLPDAEACFTKIYGNGAHYPWAQFFCICTFLLLLLMERGIVITSKYCSFLNNGNNKNILMPYLLIIVLAVHSFVEGAAIGIGSSITAVSIIYLAVIVHKGSESLALFNNLYRYTIKPRRIGYLITAFSVVTPLGIMLAAMTTCKVNVAAGALLEAIFNSLAAGTFLYLGTVHIMECEQSFENLGEISALILGIAVMAAAAIWV